MAEKFDPQVIATTLMGCVQETFDKMGRITFSQKPDFVAKEVIEYESRMRLFGLEKFNGPCYVGVINLYLNKKAYDVKESCGLIVLLVREDIAPELVKAMGNTGIDEEDEEIIMDSVGEFCNVVVGQFKSELRSFGYPDLTISAPAKYRNYAPDGADFPYSEYKYYEISFYIKKQKAIVVVVTMAPIPHIT